jgi:polyphenol oxidase
VREFDCVAAECLAWVAPAIGACCYTVSEAVAARVLGTIGASEALEPGPTSGEASIQLDLKAVNRDQLLQSGLQADRIEVSKECTSSELFFSFRRERVTGRQALAGMIIAEA